MRQIVFHKTGKSLETIDLCEPCHDGFMKAGGNGGRSKKPDFEFCEACTKKLTDAGVPMRKPHGTCAGCREDDVELVGEFPEHPEFKFCKKCCDPETCVLKYVNGICTGCFTEKKVAPAYALGDKVFPLCKPCFKRYAPKKNA